MLTGDKLETAENIGYSCKLIQEDFEKFVIYQDDDLNQRTNELISRIANLQRIKKNKCLLIEGKAISKHFFV